MEQPIFITGGSGTLGHAFLMWMENHTSSPRATVYARDEAKLAFTQSRFPWVSTVIGDIRDAERLELAILGHPTVMHFAALKRIPEAEKHPYECVMTNVFGSMNVANAAMRAGAEQLVGISTDKACKAITQYGASKRVMEGIFKSYREMMNVSIVRYGNVVSSRGSVVPIWQQQIANHQKVGVTHRDMTRFWMSPQMAVELIIDAMDAPSGSVVVPLMKSLEIMKLAQEMFGLGEDQIEEVGLRSLEKLHEDLISYDEPGYFINGNRFCISDQHAEHRLTYTSLGADRMSVDEFVGLMKAAAEVENG